MHETCMKMNCRIVCSDGSLNYELNLVKNCSEFSSKLFSDSCLCTATLHLPSFGCDVTRIAMDMLGQAGQEEGGVVVEEELLGLVGPVYSVLGISFTNSSDSALDPATGELEQVTLDWPVPPALNVSLPDLAVT